MLSRHLSVKFGIQWSEGEINTTSIRFEFMFKFEFSPIMKCNLSLKFCWILNSGSALILSCIKWKLRIKTKFIVYDYNVLFSLGVHAVMGGLRKWAFMGSFWLGLFYKLSDPQQKNSYQLLVKSSTKTGVNAKPVTQIDKQASSHIHMVHLSWLISRQLHPRPKTDMFRWC